MHLANLTRIFLMKIKKSLSERLWSDSKAVGSVLAPLGTVTRELKSVPTPLRSVTTRLSSVSSALQSVSETVGSGKLGLGSVLGTVGSVWERVGRLGQSQFQFVLALLPVGHPLVEQPEKGRAMVMVDEVAQLVADDVFDAFQGCSNQCRVEGQHT